MEARKTDKNLPEKSRGQCASSSLPELKNTHKDYHM